MTIKMFDIFYADLSQNTIGSEQGGVRPVIVIQNDIGNKFSPAVIVLPITSEIKSQYLPTHCLLHRTEKNGLKTDSMVLAEQLRSIDKKRLKGKIGYVDDVREQNDIVAVYIANITGQKRYNSLWSKIIDMLCKLIKEKDYGDAA